MNDDACWYILDARQVVGNCAMWWGPNGNGYVCDLSQAGLYTEAEAKTHRDTDIPVHRDVAQSMVVQHVRIEPLWRHEVVGPLLIAQRDARFEAAAEAEERAARRTVMDAIEFVDEPDAYLYPGGLPLGTVLSDLSVKSSKRHTCDGCMGAIECRDHYRKRIEKVDGEFVTRRWCLDCCEAHLR